MSPDQLAALGAFLSGAAAIASSVTAFRLFRKQADADCEKRLQAFKDGLEAGRRP